MSSLVPSCGSTPGHRVMKLLRGKAHGPTADRIKVQKDLFGFYKDVRHGFPHKPTAMAWDQQLKLLAIANKQGSIRIYGTPGVEYIGMHDSDQCATQIVFLPGQGRIISLTEDNFLHLWEIKGNQLKEVKSTNLEGRLKKISVLCLEPGAKRIFLGTEGGNIYQLNLNKFTIAENIIYQDIVMKGAPDDFKVHPGAVESLTPQPNATNKLLIGYARGLIVLWDVQNEVAMQTYVASQQLESLAWRNDGSQFVSAHNDGSYVVWSTQGNVEPLEPPNTPYGPYPCKAINKVAWAHDNGNSWLVFCGGMPRASYGDKCTVSVLYGEEKHTAFDLTSKVVDFCLIGESTGAPQTLIILAEEELVAVDMTDEAWPVHSAPYLNSIHASAITCLAHVDQVKQEVWDKICELNPDGSGSTDKTWPICGGQVADDASEKREILLTGHEDGSVKLWKCGGIALAPMAVVKTNKYFEGDELDEPPEDEEDEDEWPPFRKIGHFDPYSDDPRFAVKKVTLCPQSGQLIIGGTAGQIIVFNLAANDVEKAVPVIKADLVTEKEGFTWKGHSPLKAKVSEMKLDRGFQAGCILQITPPAAVNSLNTSDDWGLMAAGTAHGVVVLDVVQNVCVIAKCTLNAQDIANADDNPMSRRKSLKKSLRESFRRLRKGRSQRNTDRKGGGQQRPDPIKRELRSESPESRPVERQIEARSGAEDGLGSMVRCIHFANTFIANPQSRSSTLWAGTNSGQILIFLLTIPGSDKRKETKVTAVLAKEIQLKHRAPVIAVEVLDSTGIPINDSSSDSLSAVPHKVLITSEEQFKTFLLPTLKPCSKFKLTAHEGSRIRKIAFTTFVSRSDSNYAENCFTCLTNQGDVNVHSLPDLKKQVQTNCVRKEDVIAISTMVLTSKGEAFYMCSSSELQRVCVTADPKVKVNGKVDFVREKEDEEEENRKNETKARGLKTSVSSTGDGVAAGEAHNETVTSEISADITLDSVKDHTNTTFNAQSVEMPVISETTVKQSSEAGEPATSSTEEKPEVANGGDQQINGLQERFQAAFIRQNNQLDEPLAPLASMESTGSEFPSMVSTSELHT